MLYFSNKQRLSAREKRVSKQHPIIAVTGASGAGRGAVRDVFDKIFRREGVAAAFIEGDSFHRFSRTEMLVKTAEAVTAGDHTFSHFGPAANLFEELEELYRSYGETGTGRRRYYLHDHEDAIRFGCPELQPGDFTPWEDLPEDTDMLVYEGLHGVVRHEDRDLGRYVDLKIGVAPIINLEWIRKMNNDTFRRGYSPEAVVDSILRRMNDYVRYLIPQFKHSDINFQQVPVVDTSDPLIARDVPSADESLVVIRFSHPEQQGVDFPYLLDRIESSWMSRRNTLVVPGGKLLEAMELVLAPIIHRMIEERQAG
jgi:phosphoribulokinase